MNPTRERPHIYLDHAATSPLRSEVWAAMGAELGRAYNPASSHSFGRQAHRCLEVARGKIADLLGVDRVCVMFTGGGTQSDNLAILGFARARAGRSPRVLVSAIEHKACLGSAGRAAAEGARVDRIPVHADGTLDLEWLERALAAGSGEPTLVSVMWANNEVGTVQPMERIVSIAHRHGALVHTDAVQAMGKVPVRVDRTPVDMLTATAHKLGGPVGIGLLYCGRGIELEPLGYGGGQERSMWPGTQNPLGAVGFATALELALDERSSEAPRWRALRDHLEARVTAEIPGARIHAAGATDRLPHLVSVGIPGCDGGAVLVSLDLEGIALSGGSACSSGSGAGSSVLEALGVATGDAYATVRFSFGHDTTRADIDRAADALARITERVLALASS